MSVLGDSRSDKYFKLHVWDSSSRKIAIMLFYPKQLPKLMDLIAYITVSQYHLLFLTSYTNRGLMLLHLLYTLEMSLSTYVCGK